MSQQQIKTNKPKRLNFKKKNNERKIEKEVEKEREIEKEIEKEKEKEKEKEVEKHEIISDKYINWSNKSKNIPFKSTKKCVGNGEKKLAEELGISTPVGGQNRTFDLIHPEMGQISVKDMTNDDCTLGTEGCNDMRKIFGTTIIPLVCWINKYKSKCELANKFYNEMHKKYGCSRTTIIDGIDRAELSKTNLTKLNELINELKKHKIEKKYDSLKSEYVDDIISSLEENSLQDKLNECVRKEATRMTLIIVDKNKGWLIVKDVNRLSCPRITRGSPRINYS